MRVNGIPISTLKEFRIQSQQFTSRGVTGSLIQKCDAVNDFLEEVRIFCTDALIFCGTKKNGMRKVLGHTGSIASHTNGWSNIFVPLSLYKLDSSHSQKDEKLKLDSQQIRNTSNATASVTTVSLVQNKGTTSDSINQSIIAAGYRLGFHLLTKEKVSANKKLCSKSKKDFCCHNINACLSKKEENCTILGIVHREEMNKITTGRKIAVVGSNSSNITMWKDLLLHHTGVHK